MAKLAVLGILAILCINLSIWLVNEEVLMPQVQYMAGVTPGDIKSKVDINGTITPPQGINLQFYDLFGGMGKIWRLISTTVAGVPFLLAEFGAPLSIQAVLDALYLVVLGFFFLELVTGRDFLD